jgi:hypothetical protein
MVWVVHLVTAVISFFTPGRHKKSPAHVSGVAWVGGVALMRAAKFKELLSCRADSCAVSNGVHQLHLMGK